ncbi:zinc-binding dehydrogenase [Candidatus Poribacteria bacterium]|nr:zinc-binding dehydrogenase [Candidatus Poribacteria bacterium]
MKGVVILGESECSVKDFPDPVPDVGEVRVKMMATGICGSDLHLYHMDKQQAKKRGERIPGHEPCGIVDAVGNGVKKVKEGNRVTIGHWLGCGYCDQCAAGNIMWCEERRGYGGAIDGSHADYVIANERNCVLMPDSMSFIDGAFIACPGGTAYSSMKKLDVRIGDTVAVFGLGPVGLSGVILAKAMGGKVIGVDIIKERTELAKKLGADAVVNAKEDDPVKVIRDFTGGKGTPLAFEASGSAKGRTDIVSSLCRGGKAVFVGAGSSENVINPGQLIGSQLTLMGSFVIPLWMTWEMVDFISTQDITFEGAVTHRFSIDKASEAYRIFDEGKTGKVVFEWS